MTDTLKSRRLKAKLGMTVQPKKKTPFDAIGDRMLKGFTEQEKLELAGRGKVKAFSARSQKRIPKASPAIERYRKGRA